MRSQNALINNYYLVSNGKIMLIYGDIPLNDRLHYGVTDDVSCWQIDIRERTASL
jgi:hypothetical protein